MYSGCFKERIIEFLVTLYLLRTPYRPERVLGLSKLSFLEFLRYRHPDLSEDQILLKMKDQGKDPQEILSEHQLQMACERNLAAVLRKLDINFRITKRIENATKCVKWADLVIPIGGDGTFLLASKLITDNTKPVFGINPSMKKRGGIFTLPSKYTADIEGIFEKLFTGKYTLLMRSRIRTVMNGEGLYRQPFHIHEKGRIRGERRAVALIKSTQRKIADALQPRRRVLPWLALNEVFMGEFLAARPITLNIQFKNLEEYRIRCSGVCVCTGSGSRFWYKSMNIQCVETIRSIVELATGKKLSPEESNELLYKYHQALVYPAENLKMTYMVREMLHTTRCTKKKCCPERQKCTELVVRSNGFDAGLIIDGSISLPFNDGAFATFDIKPEYSLRNIVLI